MIRILAALALTTTLAAPALAEGMAGEMTCEAFNMLDQDGMMAAMHDAHMADDAMAPEEGMMGSDDAMAPEGGMMESGDAMASDGAMASEEGMMGSDEAMADLVKACADHPEMTVADAMKPMN